MHMQTKSRNFLFLATLSSVYQLYEMYLPNKLSKLDFQYEELGPNPFGRTQDYLYIFLCVYVRKVCLGCLSRLRWSKTLTFYMEIDDSNSSG